jgi:hypothetical protein
MVNGTTRNANHDRSLNPRTYHNHIVDPDPDGSNESHTTMEHLHDLVEEHCRPASTTPIVYSGAALLVQTNSRKRHCRPTDGTLDTAPDDGKAAAATAAAFAAAAPHRNAPIATMSDTTTPKKKRSVAQPRPVVVVPAKGYGPIRVPNVNDVLSGRGGRVNAHPGNVQFREIVVRHKKRYLSEQTKKLQKAYIAADIVRHIRGMEPSGRFLKEEVTGSGIWWEIGDLAAYKKVGQALREDAPYIRETTELLECDNNANHKT